MDVNSGLISFIPYYVFIFLSSVCRSHFHIKTSMVSLLILPSLPCSNPPYLPLLPIFISELIPIYRNVCTRCIYGYISRKFRIIFSREATILIRDMSQYFRGKLAVQTNLQNFCANTIRFSSPPLEHPLAMYHYKEEGKIR